MFRFWKFKPLSLKITIVVEPDEDSFHAYAPALKGLHVDGRTEKEAIDNAIEAIKVYMNSLSYYNDPLPIVRRPLPKFPRAHCYIILLSNGLPFRSLESVKEPHSR